MQQHVTPRQPPKKWCTASLLLLLLLSLAATAAAGQHQESFEEAYGTDTLAPDDETADNEYENSYYEGADAGQDYGEPRGEGEGSDYYYYDIDFSKERIQELYTCMCLGKYEQCHVYYTRDDGTLTVNSVGRNGSFQVENDLCRYFTCSHLHHEQRITCTQLEQTSMACHSEAKVQFFRHRNHTCCGLACVGIFWSDVEEQLSFSQSSGDFEACDDTCLCPRNLDGGPKLIRVTDPPGRNLSIIDTYVLNKTHLESSKDDIKPDPSFSMTTKPSAKPTSKHVDDLSTGVTVPLTNLTNSNQAPSFSDKDDENSKQIVYIVIGVTAGFVLLIAIIIVAAFIISRKRQQNQKDISEPKLLTSSGPRLTNLSHVQPADDVPRLMSYSKPKKDTTAEPFLNEYNDSLTAPGAAGNGVSSQSPSSRHSGGRNGNRLQKNTEESISPARSNINYSSAKDETELKKPLLFMNPIMESVV